MAKDLKTALLAVSPLLTTLLTAAPALAEAGSVPLDRADPGAIKINGVLSDWSSQMTPLSRKVSGSPGSGSDLTVRASLAYDDSALYVAAEIVDDKLIRTASYGAGEDKLTLTVAFPSESGAYTTQEIDIFHGDPGNVAGTVLLRGSGKIAGAQIVEAPAKHGFTVEAKIPWAALPPAAKVRCGLRGAIKYQDADAGGIKGVVGTSSETTPSKMPTLPIDAERGIEETFAKEKGLKGAPQIDFVADVTGDGQREHVMLWDHYLLVAGPNFREGKQFYYTDLVDAVPSLEARDLAGTGKSQLILRKRRGTAARYRESLEVHSFSESGLSPLFQHEISVVTPDGQLTNTFKLEGKQIEVALGTVSGFTEASYKEPPETSFDGVLLPWGTIKSQTYRFDGSRFSKSKEETKPAGDGGVKTPSTAPTPPAPPAPRPPTADELQDQVLSLYRRDRKLGAKDKPRFDIVTNVAEDTQLERILVFGRELVVLGKGFLGGQGYASMGMGFADAKDVLDVTTRDLNGDGHAEIIVRGVQRMPAPEDLGKGTLERELVLIYTVEGGKILRAFAGETGLSLDGKRVGSTLGFASGSKGLDLVLGPGHAVGWDQKSFPFRQETTAQNGIEPMILPWTTEGVRYKWSGSGYSRLSRYRSAPDAMASMRWVDDAMTAPPAFSHVIP